jgi:hypothetical protein
VIDSANPKFDWAASDFKAGCLPRKSKPGAVCPMAADRIKIVPSGDWDAVAAELGDDLRRDVPIVLDQNGYGSCATESTAGSLMLSRAVQGLDFVQLNPLFIYHTTSGGSDQGSSIDENLAFVRENGIAPESVWPFSKGFKAKPSAEAVEAAAAYKIEEFYDVANLNEFVSALLTGFCVVFGSNGHSILAVQYTKDYPLILNSWGTSWGDSGFGKWCSYNAINWDYGAFAVRLAS